MNVAALNLTSITQTSVGINTAANTNDELESTTQQQTVDGDTVELSAEGIAQSKQTATAQGSNTGGATATGSSSSSTEATIEALQEQIAALKEEIAALSDKAQSDATAQAQLQAKQEELTTLNNELLQLQQNQQQGE